MSLCLSVLVADLKLLRILKAAPLASKLDGTMTAIEESGGLLRLSRMILLITSMGCNDFGSPERGKEPPP